MGAKLLKASNVLSFSGLARTISIYHRHIATLAYVWWWGWFAMSWAPKGVIDELSRLVNRHHNITMNDERRPPPPLAHGDLTDTLTQSRGFYECIKNKWLPSCLSSQKSTNTNINDKAKNTERYIESCWDSGERWDRGVASEQSSSDTLLLSLLLKSIMSVSHFHFKFTEVNASNIHVTFVNQMMDPFWTHSNFHQHASILSSTTKQTSLFSYS